VVLQEVEECAIFIGILQVELVAGPDAQMSVQTRNIFIDKSALSENS
jgi:hypothetical protein